ncbi:PAS domain S-box protein [Halalkalibacter sp. AB-rgal2]|uniref:PAS domain S-box protein n=1 Tax=Halalkalibacter sp. AB-rgal2 TaxID=3242695 RepID=UPI00359CD93F
MDHTNLYRDAFENASSGKAIMTLDGQWFKVNKALSIITGYSKEELEHSAFDIVSHPDDLNKTTSLFNTPSDITDKLVIDQRFVHKDGKVLWVSLHIIMLEMGQTSYYHVDIFDISLKLKKEKELNELNHMHQLILDSINEGIFGLNPDGTIVFWNRASENMLGCKQDDMIGRRIQEVILKLKGDKDVVTSPFLQAVENGGTLQVREDQFSRKDGQQFDVEYTINPIYENAQYKGTVVIFRDVTELKKSQEYMQNSEKLSLVGQMAAGIAHEIRNPLTSLKGFLQLIQSGESAKQIYYSIMSEEFSRIEIILNELLLLAKPQVKHLEKHDLNQILTQVKSILEPQCIIENVQIVTDLNGPVFVKCDENELKQVFINLIKNGIDAMPKGGEITIRSSMEDGDAIVEVIDQGKGISEDKLAKLGQPFYTTKEKGTGLGLMVTYGIIENLGGHVQVRSELNSGTTFQITLPIPS